MSSLKVALAKGRFIVVLAVFAAAALVATSLAFAATPDPPTNLVVTAGAQPPTIAALSWTAPADSGALRYRVYVATYSGGPYSLAGETDATSFQFTTGLGGQGYYFRVTAFDPDLHESTPATAGPVASLWRESPHLIGNDASSTCWQCHQVHSSTDTTNTVQTQACYSCHGGQSADAANVKDGPVDSFALSSGHSVEDTVGVGAEVGSCSTCHEVHGDTRVARMIPASRINSVPVEASGGNWCYACHDAQNSWYGPGYPSVADPVRDASGYPVSGTWPGAATYGGAANGHRLIPETTQTVESKTPIRRRAGDCLYCHAAHRGPSRYDSLLATFGPTTEATLADDQISGSYAAICFRCHGGTTPSGFETAPVDIKRYVTSAGPNAGHRISSAGGSLPVGAPLPCYECHNPHGSTRGNGSLFSDSLGVALDTGTDAGVRAFCFSCHTASDTGRGWDSVASTFTTVPTTATVVGLSRTAGKLRLPTADGHAEADAFSCYGCHGSDYTSATGNNAHNPSVGAVPDHVSPTSDTCFGVGCHDVWKNLPQVHALYVGPGSEFPQYATTCDLCHKNQDPDRIDWASATARCTGVCHSGTTHSQLRARHAVTSASDECAACHASDITEVHGAYDDLTKCGTCHSNVWNWSKSGDCVQCHNGTDVGTHSYTPVDPEHYVEATHTATPFTAAAQGTGIDGPVPAGGEQCSRCHSATLKAAHSKTSTSGGSVTCVECHTDTTLASKDIVSANWPNDRCTDCHDTGAATTHDTMNTAHVVQAGSCAGSGTMCHDSTDLADLHATSQGGGSPIYSSCGNTDPSDPTSCHSVLDARPLPFVASASCGEGTTGCHQDKNTSNHGYDAVQHTSRTPQCYGSGCHAVSRELPDVHAEFVGSPEAKYPQYATACNLCHANEDPNRIDWASASASCESCHPGYHGVPPGDPVVHQNRVTLHTPSAASDVCIICHAGSLPELHGARDYSATDCGGCHAVHAPTNAACETCHAAADAWQKTADCSSCHADKFDGGVAKPHDATSHTFSAASDYDDTTVSGCTNSGAGCHGSETAYSTFVDYHPASGCTTGVCHTSPSKLTYAGDRECASCHDGNYQGAPDVIALAAASPDGHYSDTTHTPSGMDALVRAGGSASATCADCHSPVNIGGPDQLYSQHQALPAPFGTTTCVECHSANEQVSAVVKAGWSERECVSCHNATALPALVQHAASAPSIAATTTDTCLDAGCHGPGDVHALHKDAAGGCAISGCHDYSKQALKPTSTSCGTGGACHTDGNQHQAANHAATSSQECVDCHASTDVTVVHSATGCVTCHNNPSYPALPAGKAPECTACHNGIDVGTHVYSPAEAQHYGEATHTATPFTAAAQGTGIDGPVPSGGEECSRCHSSTLKTAHASTSTSGGVVTCVECHTDTTLDSSATVAAKWTTRTCVECHDTGAATTHDSYAAPHTVEPGTCASTGAACHDSTDLAQLHGVSQSGGPAKYQSCANADPADPSGCHNVLDTRPTPVDLAASCGEGTSGCHSDKTPVNHGYEAAKHASTLTTGTVPIFSNHMNVGRVTNYYVVCSDCHNAELGPVHANICSTCHPVPRDSFASWNKSCTQSLCHPTYHVKATATHDALASGNCDNCHVGGSEDLVADPCGSCHEHYSSTDTTPPVTTSDARLSYDGAAAVSFAVTDAGKVGIASTFYRVDDGLALRGGQAVVATPGSHTLEFWSVDQNGNEEIPHQSVLFTTTDDSVAPMTSSDARAAYEGPVSIILSASDTSTAGVKNTYYRLNGGPPTTGTNISIAPPPSGTVSYTMVFWSEDYSGNVEPSQQVTFTVTLDVAPPTTTCSAIADATYNAAMTFTLTADDGIGTGVASSWYRLDGAASFSVYTAAGISVPAPASGSVQHTIAWYSVDRAGNVEGTKSVTFTMSAPTADWTAPTLINLPPEAAFFDYYSENPPIFTLQWTSVSAPDGDPCTYQLELVSKIDSSPFSNWGIPTDVSGTSYDKTCWGSNYYWRVRAVDQVHPTLVSPWSTVDTFSVSDGEYPYGGPWVGPYPN